MQAMYALVALAWVLTFAQAHRTVANLTAPPEWRVSIALSLRFSSDWLTQYLQKPTSSLLFSARQARASHSVVLMRLLTNDSGHTHGTCY